MIISSSESVKRRVRDDPAILLVAFGTSYQEARDTFNKIKSAYEMRFQKARVEIAFTSDFIRQKIRDRNGIFVHNPLTALSALNDEGYVNVVVQSLHVIPGDEFHDLANIVESYGNINGKFAFRRLGMGWPLLITMADYKAVSAAIASDFGKTTDPEGTVSETTRDSNTAVVLMGHGTEHPANSCYSQMANILEEDYENVFLGTVEGYPAFEDVLAKVKDSGVSKVRLMPFMVVAGDHATNDMAGKEADSWKSKFEAEGFETEVYLKGMGENEEIVKIFLDHTREAFER